MFVDPNGLEILPTAECRELVERQEVGRLGFVEGGEIAILPVTYAVLDGHILIRTSTGSKMAAAVAGRPVALEVDEVDPRRHTGWSVLVRGQMSLVDDPEEIARIDEAGLHTWGPAGNDYVRLPLNNLSGRVLRSGPLRTDRPTAAPAHRDLETTD
ncbi:MAG: pyridoxamine 5'-phosphate oxidase family protein [Aquihabitans sp.]